MQLLETRLLSYDTVFIQKPLMDWPPYAFLEKIMARFNRNIIFDLDDAVYATISGESKLRLRQVLSIASESMVVIAGSKYIAEQLESAAKRIVVLPTTVDENIFTRKSYDDHQDKVCVGWTGTSSNFRYLKGLLPVFERFGGRSDMKIKIISNKNHIPVFSHIKNIEYCIWDDRSEIQDLQELDIGLMPLTDDPWTRGKCAFKLIQYMAIGIPAVASPTGTNKEILVDGVTGFFAETISQWIDIIERLSEDTSLRISIGNHARRHFLNHYSLKKNLKAMISIMEHRLLDESD
jgi:glycosyltransferase involved in cell wall biosynthesis